MAKEIERKYIVTHIPKELKGHGSLIQQGYIFLGDNSHLRVRLIRGFAYLTLKYTEHLVRDEYEYPIPYSDGLEIYSKCIIGVEKTRYEYTINRCNVAIDDFGDGLLLGEIEMPTEHYQFEKPSCFGEEVTGVIEYSNIYLAYQE